MGLQYFSADKLVDGQSDGGIAEFASEHAASHPIVFDANC